MLTVKSNPPLQDVRLIGWTMRVPDAREAFTTTGESPVDALMRSWAASSIRLVAYDGKKPVAAFGLVQLAPGVGAPWLLCADAIEDVPPKTILRLSRKVLALWIQRCPILTNFVDVRHTAAQRYLTALGAKFIRTVPYGVGNQPFIQFEFSYVRSNHNTSNRLNSTGRRPVLQAGRSSA